MCWLSSGVLQWHVCQQQSCFPSHVAGGTQRPFPLDEGGCSAPHEQRERGLHPHTAGPLKRELTLAWLDRC